MINIDDIIKNVEHFCSDNKIKLVDCIPVGRSIFVILETRECIEPITQFLKELGLEYTAPWVSENNVKLYIIL